MEDFFNHDRENNNEKDYIFNEVRIDLSSLEPIDVAKVMKLLDLVLDKYPGSSKVWIKGEEFELYNSAKAVDGNNPGLYRDIYELIYEKNIKKFLPAFYEDEEEVFLDLNDVPIDKENESPF